MADNNPNIVLDADASPLRKSFREATEELKRFGKEGETVLGKMTGPLGALQEKFIAVGAILAGGKVFKDAVEQAAAFTEESMKLGNALGTSATGASTFIAALDDIDVSQEEFVNAAKGMLKEVKNNEAGLQAMGLKTRDAAGNLRPLNDLMVDGVKVVNEYKAGTDRAIAGQAMFGKGFDASKNLLKLNSEALAENAELQQRLGILVGQENVAAWEAYDSAGDKASLTLKAFGVTIGNAVMPVLTDLANWFTAIGPAAVTVIRGALGGLVASFHLVTTGVTVLWETINAMVVSVAEPIRALAASISKAVKGDWSGAKEEITSIGDNISAAWSTAMDEMASKSQSTRDRIWNLFAEGTPASAPDASGKSADGLLEKPKTKKTAEKSEMSYYEALLAKKKEVFSQENALRDFSKAQELAYWESILNFATLSANDRLAIERKVSTLTVEVRKQEAQLKQTLEAESTRSAEALALARVDAQQAAMEGLLAAEQITATAALAQERQFEHQRYGIKRQALQDKLALYESDPELNPVEMARLKNQLLELEQQYQIKKNQLNGKYLQVQKVEATKANKIWSDLGQSFSSLWDKGIQSMMNGTLTWRNAVKAIGTELVGWFVNNVVGAMVKQWIIGEAAKFAVSQGWIGKELALKLGLINAETAAQVAGTGVVVGAKTTEATAVATANAVEAGTGAAASQAPIPIIGPILAIAAMAAIFAQVSAMSSKIRSASKGFDIPPGLNPLTQLHEEEMVLPSDIAKPLRDSLVNSGGVGAGIHMHVHTQSTKDFETFLKTNSHVIAPAMRRMARNYSPKSITSPLGRNY